jgi:[ribosomal protein S5]-alanine N-acetyltransferase
VSVNADGTGTGGGNGESSRPTGSADGTKIAFMSSASDLVTPPAPGEASTSATSRPAPPRSSPPGGGTPLRGSLVVVRDLLPGDEAAFVEWAGHQEMYEHMTWRLGSADEAAAYFHGLLGHAARTASPRRRWFLAVVDSHAALCGMAGFDVRDDGRGELGWYLSPPFWGRGYATEVSALLLGFGFGDLGLPAVVATCDPANLASRRVLEKAGFSLAEEHEETVATWRGERPRLRFITAGS